MRNVVCGDVAVTRPRSIANGPTADSMLPQLGAVSTVSPPTATCANRYSTSIPGRSERLTITALLVRLSPPPIPSIWRMCSEPMTASSVRWSCAGSFGRSHARKNGPFDVPPRITMHGIPVSMTSPCAKASEHPVDHNARLAEIIRRVAQLRELGPIQVLRDLLVFGEQVQ